MIINDKIYGKQEVSDEVIIELINSKPIQRLKHVAQGGISNYIIPDRTVTRYEHSIGVMLLLKRFDASTKEQITGLIHDVSHTAFSHVVDYVYPSKEHDFHEKFFEKIIIGSKIPEILKKYSIEIREILNIDHFRLLEKSSPDLCADRIDYFLRDYYDRYSDFKKINLYLKALKNNRQNIYFEDPDVAKEFALDYIKMNREVWANPKELLFYEIFAKILRIAIKKDIISDYDFFEDDRFVWLKIKSSSDQEIKKYLDYLRQDINYTESESDYDFHIYAKPRVVDPFVKKNNKMIKASQIFEELGKEINDHKIRLSKGFYIKLS